jgi:hypothetical protein
MVDHVSEGPLLVRPRGYITVPDARSAIWRRRYPSEAQDLQLSDDGRLPDNFDVACAHLHEGEGKLLGALAREELSAVMMLENGQLLEVWARYWESGGARLTTMDRSTLDTARSSSAGWPEHHGRPVYLDEAKFQAWLDQRYGPSIPRPLTLLEALERYSDPKDWTAFMEIEREFVKKGYAASIAAGPVLYVGAAPPGYPELFRRREAALKKLDEAFKARLRRGGFRITGFQYRRGDVPFETEIPTRQVAILHFDYAGSMASGGGLEYSGIEIEEASSAALPQARAISGATMDSATSAEPPPNVAGLASSARPSPAKTLDIPHADATSNVRHRGRRPSYDWAAFHVEVAKRVGSDPDGFPVVQADLERGMADWCLNTWGEDNCPSESTVREQVARYYRRNGEADKSV